jgi:hypothetical protein
VFETLTPTRPAVAPGAAAQRWLRERATTTPGRLVLIAIVVVIGAVGFGVIATLAARSRVQATNAARNQTERLLVQAVALSTALTDANAKATTTFLTGGIESAALRAEYRADLLRASDALAGLSARVAGSPAALARVRTIADELPVYTGLVESARANNLQGFPVGAAYLRHASALLAGTILPAADHLYAIEAGRLENNYSTGSSSASMLTIIGLAAVGLLLLAGTQFYLFRISRRVVNVPILVATLALLGVTVWASVGMVNEQHALTSARRGSDALEILSATRVLLSRAQSDENLILVNRGSDDTDPRDFAAVIGELSRRGGLLDELTALAPGIGTANAARQLRTAFSGYQTENALISRLQGNGETGPAIQEAESGPATNTNSALGTNLEAQIEAARHRFDTAADQASSSLAGLTLAIPLFAALVATLAVIGIRRRLGEYR